ncbi:MULTISPECIES: N-acetylmuramoyl-L-alanine amidase family protein [Burkholderia]|uniref:N-acetylmuramoyl-L-alanine amidase family protein n=1 Tax=Burkholderia TaxID=32008 RepID=UPI00084155AF|nr:MULTISPECIES: N-acetylmuramoyl-L-alanine amidase [Burkholderia]AOJ98966.1 cell wall hydrolase [Burkholderia vietnamiensis]MBR8161597.1 N-acetylmuramoyl-L-alanine amidase [Burkholderia vietnamiensis]MCA8145214.1 N-acetylmuramoyl-L-alanine amidase [Burkholderia vietnamiensis]MCO1347226.1 N-acetylmuramoyl-L-alanine amidase [Burkholderia vietnamiensis]MCO1428682.1 N-acetylmuramoyl-L-alanine amidase [Burkholderia vietnamiensis]
MTNRTVRRLRSSTRAVARLLACMPLLAAPLVPGAARAAGPDAPPPSARYIVVDTGHTPAHPGATGASGRVEYRYNLDLSTAVADTLIAHGDRVLRTSADGREIALDQRSTQAPDANLFVSIHHDSMQQQFIDAGRQREFHGFAVFVSERNPHYAEGLRCAKSIAEHLLAAGERPSLYHAQPIKGENRPLIDPQLGIHRFDDLVVLRTAPIPAVLVEAGVIVNPDEEKRLAQRDTIQRLGASIAGGIDACTAAR